MTFWPRIVMAVGLVVSVGRASPLLAQSDMSLATPSPDDPPARTHSGKVQASRDPALPPALGPVPSKVYVVVFSDFQCPVCRRITSATEQLPEEWPGQVRLEFRPMALPIHKFAEDAAVAALAAHRQGKFWPMHDLLFANQGALDAASLRSYAKQAGLDMARFEKDFADPALRKQVQDENALATQLGAGATPSFLVNGRLAVGWASWNGFRSQVEQELKAVDALVAKGTKVADVHALRAKEALGDDAKFKAYKAAVIDPVGKKGAAAKR